MLQHSRRNMSRNIELRYSEALYRPEQTTQPHTDYSFAYFYCQLYTGLNTPYHQIIYGVLVTRSCCKVKCATAVVHIVSRPTYNMYYGRRITCTTVVVQASTHANNINFIL